MNKILFAFLITLSNYGFALEIGACLGCHNPELKINPTLHGQHKAYIEKYVDVTQVLINLPSLQTY